jgi:hypothetical protein
VWKCVKLENALGNSAPRALQQNAHTELDPKEQGKRKGTGIERKEKRGDRTNAWRTDMSGDNAVRKMIDLSQSAGFSCTQQEQKWSSSTGTWTRKEDNSNQNGTGTWEGGGWGVSAGRRAEGTALRMQNTARDSEGGWFRPELQPEWKRNLKWHAQRLLGGARPILPARASSELDFVNFQATSHGMRAEVMFPLEWSGSEDSSNVPDWFRERQFQKHLSFRQSNNLLNPSALQDQQSLSPKGFAVCHSAFFSILSLLQRCLWLFLQWTCTLSFVPFVDTSFPRKSFCRLVIRAGHIPSSHRKSIIDFIPQLIDFGITINLTLEFIPTSWF